MSSLHSTNPSDKTDPATQNASSWYGELVFESGERTVRKNVLRTTTLIGSHEQCNLQLISPTVEPAHCVMTLDARGFRIWDLRSQDGTYVNNQKVKSARLKHGDQIRVGKFSFRLETNLTDLTREGFFIDEYRVIGILGTGGMGWLYVVQDGRSLQRMALKVLTRRTNSKSVHQSELQTRFKLEGAAGERLRHPNIVELIDYQHRADVEYLLLELFESINLQELVQRDGPLRADVVSRIFEQVAHGLEHLHGCSLIHRDIKPANLLIGNDGTTKICDFGLAFLGDDPREQELAEQMGDDCLGTADYVSPEQSVDSYRVDGRADLYSLGCSMYFALTGQVPFPLPSSREKLLAHRNSKPVPLNEFSAAIPAGVQEIVERCLEKDPDKRFQTAGELAAALAPFAAQQIHVSFDFETILRKRTSQASFRLADPKKKHYLQRIPANVASSLQTISSDDHLEGEHVVIQSPPASNVATHVPGDTSSATDPH
ncbi:MAG: protein kinase [Planctomycetaceae bacterium]|nr:protein kinase [Planctomycetaceae bacterium]